MHRADHFRYPDDYSGYADLLHDGGMILHTTDTFWSVSAALHRAEVLQSLPFDANNLGERIVLLVRDIAMMKQYITDLHPRVETLLFYHCRPLIVLGRPPMFFPDWMLYPSGKLAVLITQHPFSQQLIKALKGPLVSIPAFKDLKDGPAGFGRISSDIIERIDHIQFESMEQDRPMEDCPVIRYDSKGNIHFIRE